MSKLRIKLGDCEVDCEGSERFIKTQLPELIKILNGSGLTRESLQARDDALTNVGELKADMEVLDSHHQAISDLNRQLSITLSGLVTT